MPAIIYSVQIIRSMGWHSNTKLSRPELHINLRHVSAHGWSQRSNDQAFHSQMDACLRFLPFVPFSWAPWTRWRTSEIALEIAHKTAGGNCYSSFWSMAASNGLPILLHIEAALLVIEGHLWIQTNIVIVYFICIPPPIKWVDWGLVYIKFHIINSPHDKNNNLHCIEICLIAKANNRNCQFLRQMRVIW